MLLTKRKGFTNNYHCLGKLIRYTHVNEVKINDYMSREYYASYKRVLNTVQTMFIFNAKNSTVI